MLDTNIVSNAVSHPFGTVASRILNGQDKNIAVSVIVAAELRYGIDKRQSSSLTERVNDWLRLIPVLPMTLAIVEPYGKARVELERRGTPISANDLLIAAHALALDAILVTDNVREFERVEGLRIENWLRD